MLVVIISGGSGIGGGFLICFTHVRSFRVQPSRLSVGSGVGGGFYHVILIGFLILFGGFGDRVIYRLRWFWWL